MPSQYPYQRTIRNEYLGVQKVVRAMSRAELDWLVETQLSKWHGQAERKRQKQEKDSHREAARKQAEGLKARAETDTADALRSIEAYRTILLHGLRARRFALDWESLLDRRPFPSFEFHRSKPNQDVIRLNLLGPAPTPRNVPVPLPEEPGYFDFFPFIRQQRLDREAEARAEYEEKLGRTRAQFQRELKEYRAREKEVVQAYNAAVVEYNARLEAEKKKYLEARREHFLQQQAHNDAILDLKKRYEQGEGEAVEQYMDMALASSSYPDEISGEPGFCFEEPSKILVCNFTLPPPETIPRIVEYKYVASRKDVKTVEMKQKDFDAFYDDVMHQIALRSVHEILKADYAQRIEAVVFNGWVKGIDKAKGTPFTSCILSYEVTREQFQTLDLENVVPKECIRSLKGITAGPLAMLAPVQPILDLNREDPRFVESREVLEKLDSHDNLAAMPWEDFEHLIRELFAKEFGKTGGEVRVTQASRDRGVDAIAFDPDPIRGGKFVIQAKRYNIAVPVSAVRDLYGTMIAEGAAKGILVTTSHFGVDSREFAKDKPITLLDGENLIYLFQKHGYGVTITMLPKGDPRRGLPTT